MPDSSYNQIGQSVGAKIRAARLARRYTQSQLARPDFSISYISAIERGQIRPSLRALEILAQRLGLTSTQLLPDHSNNGDGPPSIPPNRDGDELDLALLEGQIALLQGDAPQTIARLQRLPHKGLKPEQQLRQRLLLGWAYLQMEQMPKAEQQLLDVEKQAKEPEHTVISLYALYLLAQVYTAVHNHELALQTYERCLSEMAHVLPHDPFLQAQIYNQSGQEYLHLDQPTMAVEMFQRAITITEELTDITRLQKVYCDICHHYAQVQEYLLATIYAYKCLHLHRQNILPLKRGIYQYLGHAIMKQNHEEARSSLERLLQEESVVQDTLTRASLTTRVGEWYLLNKQLEQAEEYTQNACELVALLDDSMIAVEALLLMGRVAYARSQYERGDTHFVAGLDMLERLIHPREFTDQCVFYAQLLEERGMYREALAYYRRATGTVFA